MKHLRVNLVFVFIMLVATVAHAQFFENGTTLGCDRNEGLINLRVNSGGDVVPLADQGKEGLKLTLAATDKWKVEIPKAAVLKRELVFVNATGNETAKEGVGSVTVKFTSRKHARTMIHIEITDSTGTHPTDAFITAFLLKPDFTENPNPHSTNWVLTKFGNAGEPTTGPGSKWTHTEIKVNVVTVECLDILEEHLEALGGPDHLDFDDCQDACDIRANVTNTSGHTRIARVVLDMKSEFRVISVPVHPCLNGKNVNTNFTAKEVYAISDVSAHCEAGSESAAGWKWSGSHTASDGITPPIIPTREALAQCFAPSISPMDATITPNPLKVAEGILTPVTVVFQVNSATKKFYKVHRAQFTFAHAIGNFAKGKLDYLEAFPFVVRIVPRPILDQ